MVELTDKKQTAEFYHVLICFLSLLFCTEWTVSFWRQWKLFRGSSTSVWIICSEFTTGCSDNRVLRKPYRRHYGPILLNKTQFVRGFFSSSSLLWTSFQFRKETAAILFSILLQTEFKASVFWSVQAFNRKIAGKKLFSSNYKYLFLFLFLFRYR
jgi:hypothetical protein